MSYVGILSKNVPNDSLNQLGGLARIPIDFSIDFLAGNPVDELSKCDGCAVNMKLLIQFERVPRGVFYVFACTNLSCRSFEDKFKLIKLNASTQNDKRNCDSGEPSEFDEPFKNKKNSTSESAPTLFSFGDDFTDSLGDIRSLLTARDEPNVQEKKSKVKLHKQNVKHPRRSTLLHSAANAQAATHSFPVASFEFVQSLQSQSKRLAHESESEYDDSNYVDYSTDYHNTESYNTDYYECAESYNTESYEDAQDEFSHEHKLLREYERQHGKISAFSKDSTLDDQYEEIGIEKSKQKKKPSLSREFIDKQEWKMENCESIEPSFMTTQYKHFFKMIQENPNQLLRYKEDGLDPCWYTQPSNYNNNCSKCGTRKISEFQLMPHLLNTIVESIKTHQTAQTSVDIGDVGTFEDAGTDQPRSLDDLTKMAEALNGGLDFVTIVAFTCPEATCGVDDFSVEDLVVQRDNLC